MQSNVNSNNSRSSLIIILMFCTSLFAASILTVDVFGFKLSVFRFIIILCFAYLCVSTKNLYNWYSAIMIFWFLWGVLGIVLVEDRGEWFKEVFFLFVATVSVEFFCRKMNSKELLIRMCKLYAVFIGIHNLIGYYEIITRHYLWISPELSQTYGFLYGHIPVSVFYNANNYATVLLFGIAITAISIKYSNRLAKVLYIIVFLSSVVQVYLTLSRANLIGVVIGVVFFLFSAKNKKNYRLTIFTIIMLIVGIVFATPIGFYLISRVSNYFNFSLSNGSESLREQLLNAGWKVFKETFFIGAGAGNLPILIMKKENISGGQLHLWWLEVLFTYGPIIWLLYIGAYINLLINNCKCAVRGSFVSRVLASYMIAYIVGACSSSSTMSLEPIWVAWAFIIGYRVNYESIGL